MKNLRIKLDKVDVYIKNRITGWNELVFLHKDKKFYTLNGEEICEQNYFIDSEEISKIYNLNF
jgi:hypothetical protein